MRKIEGKNMLFPNMVMCVVIGQNFLKECLLFEVLKQGKKKKKNVCEKYKKKFCKKYKKLYKNI